MSEPTPRESPEAEAQRLLANFDIAMRHIPAERRENHVRQCLLEDSEAAAPHDDPNPWPPFCIDLFAAAPRLLRGLLAERETLKADGWCDACAGKGEPGLLGNTDMGKADGSPSTANGRDAFALTDEIVSELERIGVLFPTARGRAHAAISAILAAEETLAKWKASPATPERGDSPTTEER